ncbi:short-chain fatty acid transporter [Halomonas shantousis]
MLNKLAAPFTYLFQRWMPDAFIFACLLSLLTFVLAFTVTDYSLADTVDSWGNGFWGLLTFSAQIAMTLITGHVLAHTPPMKRLLERLSDMVTTPSSAYLMVGLMSGIASLFSWGVGLIVGAIIARETAIQCQRKGIVIHYPLLVATAYSGFVIWHMGLSSSVALLIATPGHFLESSIGVIPASETIFAYWNIIMALAVLLTMPVVMMALRPRDEKCVPLAMEEVAATHEEVSPVIDTPAKRLEHARIINLMVGAISLAFLLKYFVSDGGGLNLNTVNFVFFTLGILLSRSPIHFVELVANAGRTLGPVFLQYPFYAGIMAMMADSGLAAMIARWFVGISTADTLPFWSMISGGLMNMFVPSGGGQWAVQGPIMAQAAAELGADMPRVAMGVAIGDQWTNMIQPFWTIPALAIAGLHVRSIMGYTVIALFWSGIIFSLGLLFL